MNLPACHNTWAVTTLLVLNVLLSATPSFAHGNGGHGGFGHGSCSFGHFSHGGYGIVSSSHTESPFYRSSSSAYSHNYSSYSPNYSSPYSSPLGAYYTSVPNIPQVVSNCPPVDDSYFWGAGDHFSWQSPNTQLPSLFGNSYGNNYGYGNGYGYGYGWQNAPNWNNNTMPNNWSNASYYPAANLPVYGYAQSAYAGNYGYSAPLTGSVSWATPATILPAAPEPPPAVQVKQQLHYAEDELLKLHDQGYLGSVDMDSFSERLLQIKRDYNAAESSAHLSSDHALAMKQELRSLVDEMHKHNPI